MNWLGRNKRNLHWCIFIVLIGFVIYTTITEQYSPASIVENKPYNPAIINSFAGGVFFGALVMMLITMNSKE